jgi:hypothetical protein
LFDFLVICGRENEDGLIRHRLDYRSKGLVEIQALLLLKTTDDPAGLIPEDLFICSTLDFEDLFTRKRLAI